MFEELNKRRQAVADNIAKSFENDIEKALGAGYDPEGGDGDNVEKARHGVYGDTAQNRRLNRVGQEYGSKKKEEAPSGKKQSSEKKEDGGSNKLSQSAAKASDKALERASKDPKASAEVKASAKKEMENRKASGESKKGVNSAEKELTSLLDPLNDWGDDDWNDSDKNAELFSQIRSVIDKYDMSEDEFRSVAKKYQGLDLVYTDYAPHDKIVPIAKEKIRTELRKFDEFEDDDWNDPDKQNAITNKLTFYIRHYNIDEKEWNEIVKPYADGLSGLPYEDFK
jgi:hypothetical protein